MKKLMNIGKSILNLLFPPACVVCGESVGTCGVCDNCKTRFRREMFSTCPECGKTADKCTCGMRNFDLPSERTTNIGGKTSLSLTFYKNLINRDEDRVTEKMMFALKERHVLFDFFADLVAGAVRREFDKAGVDLSDWILTYIPRSEAKKIEMGYDQSEEVVRRTAEILGIKYAETLNRLKGSEQKTLDSRNREINAANSIVPIRENVVADGKYILFDDIMTTGASLSIGIRNLRFCGAAEVFPVTIAKTGEKCRNN